MNTTTAGGVSDAIMSIVKMLVMCDYFFMKYLDY